MRSNRIFGVVAPVLCLLLGLPAIAQNVTSNVPTVPAANTPQADRSHSQHGSAFDEGPRQQARKMHGIGNVHFPITTKSAEAQAFFDQGFNLLYSFWYYEAERAFRQVAMLDPDCAMAYWGLAQTMEDRKPALKFALERQSHASDREQRYIAALEISQRAGDIKARDADYQRAVEKLILAYPDDNDAKIMMATFLVGKTDKKEDPLTRLAVEALLQQVLAKNPQHPAAHHFRIHLWDDQTDGKAALDSCRMYPIAVPNIGHAQHMPGHIYAQIGRWEDSVQALDAAARVERRYYFEQGRLPFHSWNYGHDMDYLVSGLGYLGRINEGIAIAQEMLASPCDPKYNKFDDYGITYLGRTSLLRMRIRGERWGDILHDTKLQWPEDAQSQAWKHYALGMALLGSGDLAGARKQSDTLDALIKEREDKKTARDKRDKELEESKKRANQTPAKGDNDPGGKSASATPPKDPAKDEKGEEGPTDLMRCAQGELRGRLKVTHGDFAGGLEDLKKAEELQRTKIDYNDPNPYPRPLYEALAWGYTQAKRFAEAETTLREGLKKEGDNGFALALLLEALQAQGKTAEIPDVRERMQATWRHADADLPALRRAPALASTGGGSNPVWSPTPAKDGAKQRRYGPDHWQPFPAGEWALRDANNRSDSLSAHRGKNVLLVFTLGGSCPHCNKQLQTLIEAKAAFSALGTEIVAASSDTPSMIKGFTIGEAAPPIRILSDLNHITARRYSAMDEFENRELHVTVLIDRKGREWWFRSGSEPFTDLAFLKQEIGRMNDWQSNGTR